MFKDRLQAQLVPAIQAAFHQLFNASVEAEKLAFQPTRPEFEGDVTINVFPFLKLTGKGPEQTAQAIGEYLHANLPIVARFNVIKGFLNLVIADSYWLEFLKEAGQKDLLQLPPTGKKVMVEYASPNTNKPLHLGHLRNIFLGYSVSRILQKAGNEVIKVQVINDRGIHICKSMLAWQRKEELRKWLGYSDEQTPQSLGIKGDKLVGNYYVEYDLLYRAELKRIEQEALAALANDEISSALLSEDPNNDQKELLIRELTKAATAAALDSIKYGISDQDWLNQHIGALDEKLAPISDAKSINELNDLLAERWLSMKHYLEGLSEDLRMKAAKIREHKIPRDAAFKEMVELLKDRAPIHSAAQEMLRKWEANDPDVRALWGKMNGWVYEGFNATYARAGVDFDKNYYESQTYVLGKEDVLKGKEQGVFYEKDGAIWVDNTAEGLDEKVLLRRDGTSVYMTQDIGTAIKRFEEFPGLSRLIYTVGNEQDYHFKVLFIILRKLGFPWANELFHLSYGMVDLPSGKMKSREGTVVDADDLIQDVVDEARRTTEELGKLDEFTEQERARLFEMIGLAALKYFLLKVDPKKRMLFDPAASIDLQGHTGPFIQYTYARIRSLLRKAEGAHVNGGASSMVPEERAVIKLLHQLPGVLNEAANKLDPSSLANHTYELVKAYNSFYQSVPVLKEEDASKRAFRIALSAAVADATKQAMWCLGIEVPERM